MALRIGDTAPNFQADTTQGKIDFHQWIGDGWAVLFSHPKDFTPVCTTELGTMARMKSEFDKRNTKIIGLSVDPVDDHSRWARDIEETQGTAPNYPIIGDADLTGYAPVAQSGYSPLLFFSNAGAPPACNVNAIQFSGSGITWEGLMYAPRGEVKMSSSSNVAVLGSIIAYTVEVSGSDFSINWVDDTSGVPRFIVELQA